MALSGIRKIPLAAVLMLGCSALSLPAHAGWFDFDSTPKPAVSAPKPEAKPAASQPAGNLEDSVRQAQMLRLAGQYPEAIKHLSQLMMVAADDSRVISEYGKTLAAMGRASDAVNFLTRAQQLQPGDWTVYSALGVAYDQIGDQKSAQLAYEHALSIKPEEPSVLNNYALSRMLAKDPDLARKLALRAESAGGSGDVKIARNIAMIRSMAASVPAPVAAQAAPQAPVTHSQLPAPVASNSIRPPQPVAHTVVPQNATADNRVVMQRVPVDPLAGPVASFKPATPGAVATHAPNPLQPQAKTVAVQAQPAKPDTLAKQIATIVKTDVDPAAKPIVGKPAAPSAAPVAKTAETSKPATMVASKPAAPVTLAETRTAPAKPVALTAAPVVKTAEANKPAAVVAAKMPVSAPAKLAEAKPSAPAAVAKAAEASKPATVVAAKAPVPAAVKTAETKPAAEAAKPVAAVTLKMTPIPVKAVDTGKAALTPKVLPAATTAADAKPLKAAAKDAIPGLRMSANAY